MERTRAHTYRGGSGPRPEPVAIVLSPGWAAVPDYFHATTARALIGRLAPELETGGRPVCVIVPGPVRDRKLFGGVPVVNVAELPGKTLWPWLNAVVLGRRMAHALRRRDIRVAHLFGVHTETDALTFLTLRARVPAAFVISRQTMPAQVFPGRNNRPGPLMRALHRRAGAIVVPSAVAAREFLALFPDVPRGRVFVIPNGVDTRRFGRSPTRFLPNGHRPFVLSVARQSPYKGHDLLVWAFFDILKRGADLDLVVCGMDHSRGHVAALVRRLKLKDRVRFTGQVGPETVKKLLDKCLFFVLPSRVESFGMAALEAMAAGKAVVVSRGAGVSEIIRDGRDGFLVPPGDPRRLAATMWRLAQSPSLRDRAARHAQDTAEKYGWPAVAKKFGDLYDRVAARPA